MLTNFYPKKYYPEPLRRIRFHDPEDADSRLVFLTNDFTLSAFSITQLYKARWRIELFFRWFKKVLEADRLLSLDEGGLTIVIYCALIASMLIVLWTGRKPTKRTFELICFYFAGWISDEEFLRHLQRLAPADPTP